MEELIEKISEEFQIDKSNWVLQKFGDVAIQQKQNVDRENTDLTRYVKGEHMGSEDLHLRSWGELKDEYLGPAFIRRFDEGDILYGSRRTYLRKVVIAPFSGITSNTTFVIKANEENIDKRLLPFVMMSQGFTENSIRNSKGSVNPYVNWKDIAKYEFLLPPKDQQAQLAKLLWAMDEVIEKKIRIYEKLQSLYITTIETELLNRKSDKLYFGDILNVIRGVGYKPDQLIDEYDSNCCVILRSNNISNGLINFDEIRIVPNTLVKEAQFLTNGDFAICMSNGSKELVGKCAEFRTNERNVSIGSFCAGLRPKSKENRQLLRHLVNSQSYRVAIQRILTGSAINNLKPSDIEGLFLRVDLSSSKSVLKKLDSMTENRLLLDESVQTSKSLQKSLINQVF